ncbi:hypothetical protein CEP88_13270 [Roseobacter denitrificans]|uniref:Uncharacterized protein n=1 Tax=Roseobacter denitrificans (strain ATCC 33942 / OCh 114) TaxID=375451 RepID=Q16CH4_ROSDO|nr:hypothetical protein [Roseobacter denitrificans]ABG30319.1 hypothetical protein RD1_0619 [Roseobacter denitrificans OCh 114]AVL53488.1 hypothetical protein CEP88_13270 [Roseobacter denitrificans]SFF71562.1 hypothetical protein SAMN05443635_101325 [Roseobacter denitrificans OCh 114]
MARQTDIVLILGSGPNAPQAEAWPRGWFDRIVAINNAWRIREDWDDLVFPEDFPEDRRPQSILPSQRFVQADQFVPAQNAYGGFVYAGGTMAFTTAYWALQALRPKVMAFLGCDMVYPKAGPTHFYGTGAADPLRPDITLQDLGAKSARLGMFAAAQGCRCVNLSSDPSKLMYQRANPDALRDTVLGLPDVTGMGALLKREDDLGYFVATGRYWERDFGFDAQGLAALDASWRALWSEGSGITCAA